MWKQSRRGNPDSEGDSSHSTCELAGSGREIKGSYLKMTAPKVAI